MEKKKSLIQFIKYAIVGCSNTLVSKIIYFIIIYFGGNYQFANLCGFVISVLNAYYWSNKYVFKQEEGEERVWWKVLLKTYVAYIGGFILDALLLYLWIDVIDISRFLGPVAAFVQGLGFEKIDAVMLGKLLAAVINIFFVLPINFVMNKYWAYRKTKKA